MADEQGLQPDLAEFPPTVLSIETPEVDAAPSAILPWATEMRLATLWRTAVQMSLNAEQIGAEFRAQKPGRAALFAFAVELMALSGVSAALLPLLALLFPRYAFMALLNSQFALSVFWVVSGSVLVLAVAMVALHWFWAFGMEMGAWYCGLPRNWRSGLALASYSCGWDLITSPLGLALLFMIGGKRSVRPTLLAALRAPRPCVSAYLQSARGFSVDEQRRVLVFAAWLTAPAVLVFAALLLVGLVVLLA